jgi:hypothetical protein
MVGSKSEGTMADNVRYSSCSDYLGRAVVVSKVSFFGLISSSLQSVEAVPGYTVDQIHEISHLSTPYKPNIVLINAGVNDCENGIDIPSIGSRLGSLLDDLFKESPGTTIIVSTLIPGTDPDVERYRTETNRQYRLLVGDRRARGQKVVLAESRCFYGFPK